jgi:hypothetical protein
MQMNRKLGWAFFWIAGCIFVCTGVANAAQMYNINFETDDDFVTPLVHGESIYSTPRVNHTNPGVAFSTDTRLEFGRLIRISSANLGSDGNLGPAIFDSNPTHTLPGSTLDDDLLVGLGNVLMLQRDESPNTMLDPIHGLKFKNPNDEATPDDRGSIVIDFLVPNTHPMSIDLVDVDDNVNLDVILTDQQGHHRTYAVPSNWTTDVAADGPSGYQTLSLETLLNQTAALNATGGAAKATQDSGFNAFGVMRLEVQFMGTAISGAIDNLVFTSVPEPSTLVLGFLSIALIMGLAKTRAGRRAGSC